LILIVSPSKMGDAMQNSIEQWGRNATCIVAYRGRNQTENLFLLFPFFLRERAVHIHFYILIVSEKNPPILCICWLRFWLLLCSLMIMHCNAFMVIQKRKRDNLENLLLIKKKTWIHSSTWNHTLFKTLTFSEKLGRIWCNADAKTWCHCFVPCFLMSVSQNHLFWMQNFSPHWFVSFCTLPLLSSLDSFCTSKLSFAYLSVGGKLPSGKLAFSSDASSLSTGDLTSAGVNSSLYRLNHECDWLDSSYDGPRSNSEPDHRRIREDVQLALMDDEDPCSDEDDVTLRECRSR
jgi:hypothetical protein